MEHLFAGSQLAITVAAFSGIGYWVDKRYGVSPWGVIIGALVGIILGLFGFIETYVRSKDGKPS